MAKIKINSKRCKACQLCILFCPLKHIKKGRSFNEAGYKPVVFLEKKGKPCTGCSACAIICPEVAIEVYK